MWVGSAKFPYSSAFYPRGCGIPSAEPPLTHRSHLGSILCCTPVGLDQCFVVETCHAVAMQSSLPKILSALLVHPSFSQTPTAIFLKLSCWLTFARMLKLEAGRIQPFQTAFLLNHSHVSFLCVSTWPYHFDSWVTVCSLMTHSGLSPLLPVSCDFEQSCVTHLGEGLGVAAWVGVWSWLVW